MCPMCVQCVHVVVDRCGLSLILIFKKWRLCRFEREIGTSVNKPIPANAKPWMIDNNELPAEVELEQSPCADASTNNELTTEESCVEFEQSPCAEPLLADSEFSFSESDNESVTY